MQTPPRSRVRVAKKTPIPASIEIHNLLPLLMMIPEQQIRRRQRHEHSVDLLYWVKLQIVIVVAGTGEENVLYEAVHPTKTVCPSWRGLNDDGIVASDLAIEEYESMTARFSVVSGDDDKRDGETFLRVPIHPSKLITVEKKPDTFLPLNAVLITFSDESTRVSQSLYKLLAERSTSHPGQVEAVNQSVEKSFDSDYSRFDDDIFRTLDQVTPGRGEPADLLLAHDECDGAAAKQISLDLPDLLASDKTKDQVGMVLSHPKANNNNRNDNIMDPSSPSRQRQRNNDEDSPIIVQQDLVEENLRLEKLIEEDTLAFETEWADVAGTKDHFELLVRQHSTCEEQTSQVVLATQQLQHEYQKTAFLLQSQRILLIRDLRIVYPVSVDRMGNDQRYRIRGLEIPNNVNAGTVPEEEVAAAIGCLCHLVAMMSKYLSVQLRYRLYCHASRSAVRDDRGVMFPLFLAGRSNIDRERFEIGVRMLHQDVVCICKERDIQVAPKLHILAKVELIYEHLIEGY